MGMYTEIRVNAVLREDVPKEVVDLLKLMLPGNGFAARSDRLKEHQGFDHPFFLCDRWRWTLSMGSPYFDTTPNGSLVGHHLKAVANLKNYCQEIGQFAAWLRPYCMPQEKPIVTQEYENEDEAIYFYYQNGRVEIGNKAFLEDFP